MIDLAANFKKIEERILKSCLRVGRNPDTVKLLPVSKTKHVNLITEAYSLGYRRFGENKAQEIEKKNLELGQNSVEFCLIGNLQTNKVNKIAKYASEIHSLDSLKTAVALERALQKEGRSIEALIQVNTSGENQKSGLAVDELFEFVNELSSFSSIKVNGLMTLALFSHDEALVRPCFSKLRSLQEKLKQEASGVSNWDVLSMGMSKDLEWAIEEGSTEVRIGTDIFGPRV